MITCKEDLIGTYVDGRNVELGNAYQKLLFSFGVNWLDFNDQLVRYVSDSSLTSQFCFDGDSLSWNSKEFAKRNYDKELTLEDLKPQTKEVEWVNGLPPVGVECWFNFKLAHPQKCTPMYFGSKIVVYVDSNGNEFSLLLDEVNFSKIETEADRKEREELEASYDLLCVGNKALNVTAPCTFDEFKLDKPQCDFWLSIVRKTNYKVKGE